MRIGIMRAARPQVLGLVGAAALVATGFGFTASAQDDEAVVAGHPAHIHVGTCAELDPNPLVPLTDVTVPLVGDDNDQAPTSEDIRGALDQPLVETSTSDDLDTDVEFDQLFETSHAINIHESAENIGNYIACGDIGGVVTNDEAFVPLYTQNDSGFYGIAKITKDGDGFDVDIYLAQPQSPTAAPEGEATPGA